MRCSVVIPCHGGVELTRACVDALVRQDPPPAEILLVDNASPDDTPALHGRHGTVRVLRQERNLGFAGGVNAGIRAATSPWILVLNNDTLPAPGMLRELLSIAAADPRIGAVAPVSNHVKGAAMLPIGSRGRDAAERERIAAELQRFPIREQDVDTLAGLCLLLHRTTLDRLGLFDERFGHGNYEDDDFCLRLRLHGLRLVVARRAFLHHEGHATLRSMGLDLAGEIGRRFVQFAAKWSADPAGRAVIAAMRGDIAAAGGHAAAARAAWPLWPDADWHIARHGALLGRHDTAAAHLAALLRACPRHSEAAVERIAALLAADDRAGADHELAALGAAFHLSPAHVARVHAALGEHAYRHGDFAAAADEFAAALAAAPQDGALHNWIGLCCLGAGDLLGATTAFESAVGAGFALAHTNLGITWHRRGHRERASESFARAVELLPDDPVARQNLAACAAPAAT